jgi:hypothetical protein
VTWKGTPIDRLTAPKSLAKLGWLFVLRRVARWRGLTWESFRRLDTDDAAAYVAEYECEMKLESLDALDQARKRRRMSKRKP